VSPGCGSSPIGKGYVSHSGDRLGWSAICNSQARKVSGKSNLSGSCKYRLIDSFKEKQK